MLKKNFILALILFLGVLPLKTEPWNGRDITVTAGTAIRIVSIRTMAVSLSTQMTTGGSGRGYLLYAPPDVTCAKGGAGTTLIAELSPASATGPGGQITVPFPGDPTNPQIDVHGYCVDGATNSDHITTSWNLRN